MENRECGERNYKAFISYRHKPLDMKYAKKLQRCIERYVIPKDLRRNGEKKVGIVFRDQEELPISSSLADNITQALDHSEYLIVICSPDTPESMWVQREISYFASQHGSDHILALLIHGTPEESFPRQLLEVRDEDGRLVKLTEPLAANIVASSELKRSLLFQTESLRILAALLGCPYDVLYRREHRYKMRRMASVFAAACLILAGFIGMLLNRNVRIHEQYLQVQINESRTLAALSQTVFREGDYRSAIENALDALPGRNPEREYVAAAEYVLSNEMYLYQSGMHMRYIQSMDQETEIDSVLFSENAQFVSACDSYGLIRTYHPISGALLWETRFPKNWVELAYIHDDVLMATGGVSRGYAALDGREVWRLDAAIVAHNGETGLMLESENGITLTTVSLLTGEEIRAFSDPSRSYYDVQESAISSDGCFAAVLYSMTNPETYIRDSVELVVYDLEKDGDAAVLSSYAFRSLYMAYQLQFTEDHALIIGCSGNSDMLQGTEGWDGPFLELFAYQEEWKLQFHDLLDFGNAIRNRNGIIDTSDYLDFIWSDMESLAVAAKNRIIMIDRESGRIRWAKELPGYVTAGRLYKNGALGLALSNGVVTLCIRDDGTLSSEMQMAYYDCDFELNDAAICGESYRASSFAVVPAMDRTRISVISFCEAEGRQPFPYEGETAAMRFQTSPSETWLVGTAYDSTDMSYSIVLVDPAQEHKSVEMVLEGVKRKASLDSVFVTDDGMILLGEKVVNPFTRTVSAMTADGSIPDRPWDIHLTSCMDRQHSSILTASLLQDDLGGCSLYCWKDGQLFGTYPIPIGDEEKRTGYSASGMGKAISGSGYAVITFGSTNQGGWEYFICSFPDGAVSKADYFSMEEEETMALAQTHPWIAVQGRDSSLRLMNVVTGELIQEYTQTLPGPGLTKLMFAQEDEWLIALTNGGEIGIYSTKDGTLLNRSSYASKGVRFSANARYDVSVVPDQNRILIMCDDTGYTEPFCISLNLQSFETNGFYAGFSNWLSRSGQSVILSYNDPVCLSPLFTIEDIQKMAENLLQTGITSSRESD